MKHMTAHKLEVLPKTEVPYYLNTLLTLNF